MAWHTNDYTEGLYTQEKPVSTYRKYMFAKILFNYLIKICRAHNSQIQFLTARKRLWFLFRSFWQIKTRPKLRFLILAVISVSYCLRELILRTCRYHLVPGIVTSILLQDDAVPLKSCLGFSGSLEVCSRAFFKQGVWGHYWVVNSIRWCDWYKNLIE
jgi:hypothetical protein